MRETLVFICLDLCCLIVSKTLQLEKGECHLCFASMSTNRQALIYDPTNGGKKEKGPEGRHAMQAISFPPTEL